MTTYRTISKERNALMAAIKDQVHPIDQRRYQQEDLYVAVAHCNQSHHHHLEYVENMEQSKYHARDQYYHHQASHTPAMPPLRSNPRSKLDHPRHIPGLAKLEEDSPDLDTGFNNYDSASESEFDDCFSYYGGDDGHDADGDYVYVLDQDEHDGDDGCDSDSSDDDNADGRGCVNCHLQERMCGRRDCGMMGFCRILDHDVGDGCVCYE